MGYMANEISASSACCCSAATQASEPPNYSESRFSDLVSQDSVTNDLAPLSQKKSPSSLPSENSSEGSTGTQVDQGNSTNVQAAALNTGVEPDQHIGHQAYQQADYTQMYEEIAALHGYDIKADISSLMNYAVTNFKPNSIESTAAFVVGMDKISRHLYEKVLPDMVQKGGASREHAFNIFQTSTHFNHKHGGTMGEAQDKGDFAAKHILNYFKKYDAGSKYLSRNDVILDEKDRAELTNRIAGGETFADIFGQGGSSDGGAGESYHAAPLAAWVGSPHGAALEGASASVRYPGDNPANGSKIQVDQVKKAPGNPNANSQGYAHTNSGFDPSRVTWQAGNK